MVAIKNLNGIIRKEVIINNGRRGRRREFEVYANVGAGVGVYGDRRHLFDCRKNPSLHWQGYNISLVFDHLICMMTMMMKMIM